MKANKKHKRILISAAGGAGTIELIKHLRSKGHWVAAIDMDPYAAGLYLADMGIKMAGVLDPTYFKHIRALIIKHNIDIYIPLIDEELLKAKSLEKLHPGLQVLTPQEDFIQMVLDKYLMYRRFDQDGISCPATLLGNEVHQRSFSKEMIVKPITGRGSRGVVRVNSWKDWKNYFKTQPYNPDQVILQEYINGTEYTVSGVVGKQGHVHAVVPKRVICKKGITYQSMTVKHDKIDRLVRSIAQRYSPHGPFNVQLMEKRSTLYVLEVNPRFSTTVAHTMAAGVDEVGCLINDFCNDGKPKSELRFTENLVMLRHMTQLYVLKENIK